MRKLVCFSLFPFIFSVTATTFNYTDTQTGNNLIPLGYPVPIPVDSLTPVDGFRTYESLNLRHQQMSAESSFIQQISVGETIEGNPIWAYQLSDPDTLNSSGIAEASALLNSGIHAREWQTPEAATGYIEYLFNSSDDQHMGQYILENVNLVIIPVLNIDGFKQTQRFAAQVTSSEASPRDGRMRRKNMRGVDQNLNTLSDNLNGIDLNRNNGPYWATNNQRSSPDQTSIVHHGAGAASEPETQALQQAAILAGESRLRLYTDNHSFTQVYFAPSTGNQRRDDITADIAFIMRAANGFKYRFGPSAAGGGIGSTDEFFANTYQIPSYTLEIEPENSGADYGGFGPSHSGFILPNSEVSRMREETALATMAGLYAIADIPYLLKAEVWDEAQQEVVLSFGWQSEESQRVLTELIVGQLQGQTNYQLNLIFNKPMRWIENGQVSDFSTLSDALGISLSLRIVRGEQVSEIEIDTSQGQWQAEIGYSQYKTDTFSVPFRLTEDFDWSQISLLALEVDTQDFTGQELDTNPGSIIDWQNGAWTNYEDTQGNVNTDKGGVDLSMRWIDDGSDLFITSPDVTDPPAPPPISVPNPPVSSSGGGGTSDWLFMSLLLTILLRRFKKGELSSPSN